MNAILTDGASVVVNPYREREFLLLGAGNDRRKRISFEHSPERDFAGSKLVTLDIDPGASPDVRWDLNDLPYPFEDNRFDEIHAYEVLEHCGRQGDWRFFFAQFSELWRILRPGGFLCATVPMWNSPWAWGDPGHSRVISKETLTFLIQDEYKKQVGRTPLTDYRAVYKADFEIQGMSETEHQFGFVLRAIK